ncbi:MAG: hypothetical protein AUK49_04685 [Betaproteobacteria bacterium CG2_30_68_42]|nr:MAG: hypothetical protein AUK49_04685 [Betaproteobacteria bacterium CG2_30_68_42]
MNLASAAEGPASQPDRGAAARGDCGRSTIRRVNRSLRLITAVARAARAASSEDDLLAQVCAIVVDVGGFRFAWIGRAENDPGRRVRPVAYAGFDAGYLDQVTVTWDEQPTGRGPVGTTIRSGRPTVVRDADLDSNFSPWRGPAAERGYRSVAAFPLAPGGRIEGAIAIYAGTADAFGHEECALLAELASDISYALAALRGRASREETEAALRRSETSLARAQRIAGLGSWEWDLRSGAMLWSDQTFELFGLDITDVEPSPEVLVNCAHREDRPELAELFERLREFEANSARTTFRIFSADGSSVRHLQMVAEVEFDDEGPNRVVGVLQDISERMNFERRLEDLATHDTLTGLPNRHLLNDRLEQGLARAGRGQRMLALAFVDLDRFKNVNDTLGHDAGDQLLREVARRLVACLRNGDTVARQGGDEFVVLLTDLAKAGDAGRVAQKMLDALSVPVMIGPQEIVPSASIGLALFPRDGERAQTLMMNADQAMYSAKQAGRNQYRYYDPDMNRAAAVWLEVNASLHRALERDEFVLHYQPKVDLKSGRITGAEALLRWNSRVLGMVSPDKFIPLLEETGRIVEVGEWVIETACRQGRQWTDCGLPPLDIAVNLSVRQFQQPDLAQRVRRILDETGFPPERLELEITESMVAVNVEHAIVLMGKLCEMGLKLAIDDFGTGYSSLHALKRFPVSTLKIDRSFVKDLPAGTDDAAIARAVIQLGHGMGLAVVAEGVETEAQRDFLRAAGCDSMQGYLFARPMPAAALEERLRAAKKSSRPARVCSALDASALPQPPTSPVVGELGEAA